MDGAKDFAYFGGILDDFQGKLELAPKDTRGARIRLFSSQLRPQDGNGPVGLPTRPADIGELADALGIEQFCVMGLSCGGPFAAATAHALPQRVTRLALVSSVGRFDIPGGTKGMGPGLMYFRLARYAPWLSRRMVRMMGDGMKSNRQEMTRRVIAGPPHPRPRRPILPRRGAYLRAGQSYC